MRARRALFCRSHAIEAWANDPAWNFHLRTPVNETRSPEPNKLSGVVFFYYEDLGPAADWYEHVIGFRKIHDEDWVKIFEVVPGCRLGLVSGGGATLKPVLEKGAMFSVETDDVEGWYRRLSTRDGSNILRPIDDAAQGAIRSFFLEDPGGYLLEFFTWRTGDDTPAR
jgi:catechol 2,3-dioxygenase-like lactoylglutathione lyase family enzyme